MLRQIVVLTKKLFLEQIFGGAERMSGRLVEQIEGAEGSGSSKLKDMISVMCFSLFLFFNLSFGWFCLEEKRLGKKGGKLEKAE